MVSEQSKPLQATDKLITYKAAVTINKKVPAVEFADTFIGAALTDGLGRLRLDYIVDGSLVGSGSTPAHVARPGGYAVVAKSLDTNSYNCNVRAFKINKGYIPVQPELMEIVEALASAVRVLEGGVEVPNVENTAGPVAGGHGKDKPKKFVVRILSDSHTALHILNKRVSDVEYSGQFQRDITRPIPLVFEKLVNKLGTLTCDVEMYWVPRNTIVEHIIADKISYLAGVGVSDGQGVRYSESSRETKDLDEEISKAVEMFQAKKIVKH